MPTVIDSFYLVTLGSYRAFYILNWILRAAQEHHFDPVAAIFGIIQTAFYIDFAWVYWTRQRVKLRNGGVVDSEDLSRGWLVSRVLGKGRDSMDEEEGHTQGEAQGRSTKPGGGRWGARGVSISADDQVLEPNSTPKKATYEDEANASQDELSHLAEEAPHAQDHEGVLSPTNQPNGRDYEHSNGSEWLDGGK